MTDREAIRALKAVRAYCQPEHLPAVDRAIAALGSREREGKDKF